MVGEKDHPRCTSAERQFYALSGAVVSKLCSVRGRLEMDGSDSSNWDEKMVKKMVNRI